MTDFTPHSGDKQSTIDSGRKMCRILNFWDLYMVSQSKALLSASEPPPTTTETSKKGAYQSINSLLLGRSSYNYNVGRLTYKLVYKNP